MIRRICAVVSLVLGLGWASATLAQAPTVVSITPDSSGPSALSENFTVTFSEAVTGVDASDFELTTTGSVTGVSGWLSSGGSVYSLTVTDITGVGTLRVDLKASGTGIQNGASMPIAGGFTSGGVRTIGVAAPAPVPTMNEWAMILFGAALAAGAALWLQKRRALA